MRIFFHSRRVKLLLLLMSGVLIFAFQNCGNSVKFANIPNSAQGTQNLSGSLTVTPAGTNPNLDLFFIVDNSASMAENQAKLSASFSNIFSSNSSLSNFSVNVYLFSTASTVNLAALSQIPVRSPATVTSVPTYTDLTDLINTPGNIYGIWNNTTGTYGTAPFSEQFGPAAVVTSDNNYSQGLSISKQGSISALSQEFQNRLAYLNPTNQFQGGNDPVSTETDISSGLCTMARILKHSSSYIQPGDAAAFVIVSDDNDRLTETTSSRNPAGLQCVESDIASNELINGSCGHYQGNYTYDTTSTLSYQSNTKFTYQTGTKIAYSYPSSASCQIQYNNGYSYSWTYTAINTLVSFTQCTLTADGFCVSSAPATITIPGNYVGSGGTCLAGATTSSNNVLAGTTPTCTAADVPNQTGAGGVDANSNGSTCSSQLISTLSSSTKQFASCTITGKSTTTKNATGQPLNSCSNYCSANSSTYPGCTLLSSSVATASGSLSLNGVGLSCSSQCPSGDTCGTGTISTYISNTYGGTCGAPSSILSSITVLSGVDSAGNQLSCNSTLGSTGAQSGSTTVCQNMTVSNCLNSLEAGSSGTCVASSSAQGTVTAPLGVSCSTACSSSSGFCPASFSNVASYLASQGDYCTGANPAGQKSLSITFTPATAQGASCSSLCSNAANGSCDGKGYGATNGATVATYIQSLGGGSTCAYSTGNILSGSPLAASNSNPTASCTDPTNPVFFASSSAYPGTATNYTAGTSTPTASAFISYIQSQSTAIFGVNPPLVAVIGHLTSDTSLTETDPSLDYFSLAQAMGSNNPISTITAADYSPALTEISNFIVQKSQNSWSLGLPAGSVVYSVSVEHQGTQTWVPVASSLWSWTGGTLSVSPSAGLVTGDQLMFQYNE